MKNSEREAQESVTVLFVCLGNICRSPMAEGLFAEKVRTRNLEKGFAWDSAGTGAWHAGELADRRMRETALAHGLRLTSRARQVKAEDFTRFDWILAMDHENLRNLESLRPVGSSARLALMRDFDPEPGDRNVPDPYYGGQQGFETVYSILDRSTERFLEERLKERD